MPPHLNLSLVPHPYHHTPQIRNEIEPRKERSHSLDTENAFTAFFEDFAKIFESDPLQGTSHYHDLNVDDDDDIGLATPPLSPIPSSDLSPPSPSIPTPPLLNPSQRRKAQRKRGKSLSVFACCTSPQDFPPIPDNVNYNELPRSASPLSPNPNRPRLTTTDGTPSRQFSRRPSMENFPSIRESLSRRLSFLPGNTSTMVLDEDDLVEEVRDKFPDCAENELRRFSRKCGGNKQKVSARESRSTFDDTSYRSSPLSLYEL